MKDCFEEIKNQIPVVKRVSEFDAIGEYSGIYAITYDSAKIDGKKTKTFAYLGYPKHASGKSPAVVLVHGGGGVPFLSWVKMWNERGYVAIAMSTTGDFPMIINAGDGKMSKKETWNHGLCGEFVEDGYVNAPDNDSMSNSNDDITKQWIYHAVSQVILAKNLLCGDARVIPEKVGIVGVSWGGVIASIAIGYDSHFAFAVPIYGSGYLRESMGSVGGFFREGRNPELWLAERNFCYVDMPVLWLCWNQDIPFSMNSNSKSYIDTVANNEETRFSAVHEMHHDHCWAWVRKEPFAFADSVCKSGKRLPAFQRQEGEFLIINPDDCMIPLVKLYYIREPLSYTQKHRMEQEWKTKVLRYQNKVLDYQIPAEAKAYYFEISTIMDAELYITCSELVEVNE